MLSRVLLHVIVTARPINGTANPFAFNRPRRDVSNLLPFIHYIQERLVTQEA